MPHSASKNLDDGAMWPTAFALKELTAAAEARIGKVVKKAVQLAQSRRHCAPLNGVPRLLGRSAAGSSTTTSV